ncbi:MAG TPA: cytochrome c oxidase subunit 3 [Planctomycetia bacterium]|nr:cytochrome c oxidase subunit 3 [Planctomycetia bacterium]
MNAAEISTTELPRVSGPAIPNGRVGFYLFLGTEAMLFAGWLSAFLAERIAAGSAWPNATTTLADGATLMKPALGAINTGFLLLTSAFVGLAARNVRRNRVQVATWCAAIALCLASAFMGVKAFEYSEKIHHGLLPATAGEHLPLGRLWSSYYFGLTGLHGVHVIVGMLMLAWMTIVGVARRLDSRYEVATANIASYWHLVDVVWIALFVTYYLV